MTDEAARQSKLASKFPSYKGRSQSGSEKLAAYKKATSGTSKGQTPEEYEAATEAKTQEEISSSRLITSTGERIKGIDRTKAAIAEIEAARQPTTTIEPSDDYVTPVVPTPVKDVKSWQRFREEYKEEQAQPETYYSPITSREEPTIKELVTKSLAYTQEKLAESQETGYETTKDYEMSEFSQYAYEKSQALAEKLRNSKAAQTAESIISPLPKYVGGSVLESTARTVEMGGMIPGGLETIASSKETAKAALITGAISVPVGLVTSAKEEPGQLVTDIAFQTAVGAGIAKGGSVIAETIKPTLPKITLKSTIGEPVIKLSIPEAEVTPLKATTLTQAEYVRAVGTDLFKISETPIPKESPISTGTSLSTIIKEGAPSTLSDIYTPSPKQTIQALVGETKGGFTDVYIKVDQPTLRSIGEQYFGKVETIITPEGKLTSFEPTALREVPSAVYPKKYTPLPETPEFKLIGKSEGTKSKLPEFPFETAKKIDVYKSELEFTEGITNPSDIYETSAIKQLLLKGGQKEIPEFGTRTPFEKTTISKEELAYAKIFSTAIRDEPMYYEAASVVSKRILPKMGIKNIADIQFKIASEGSQRFSQMQESGFEGVTVGSTEAGRKYEYRFGKETVVMFGTENLPPQVILPESKIPIDDIVRTFGHEVGHAVSFGGGTTTSPLSKYDVGLSNIYAEAVAEKFGTEFSKKFKDTYGIDVDTGKSFMSQYSVAEKAKLIKKYGLDPHIVGFAIADLPIRIGKPLRKYTIPGSDILNIGGELRTGFEGLTEEAIVDTKRRVKKQQEAIYKEPKTEEELIAEFEKEQAAFLEEEKLLAEFEKQQELFMQEEQQIFKQKPVFKERQRTSEMADFLRSDVESILSRQEPRFKITPETVTKVRLKQKPVTLQKPKTSVIPIIVPKQMPVYKGMFAQKPIIDVQSIVIQKQQPIFKQDQYFRPVQTQEYAPLYKQATDTETKTKTLFGAKTATQELKKQITLKTKKKIENQNKLIKRIGFAEKMTKNPFKELK